jgi:hypothetical protein
MQRMFAWALLIVTTVGVLSSCTKDPLKNLSEDESRIYITNRDSTVNFSSYKTYSIADSVLVIDNGRVVGKQSNPWDAQMINALQNAMNARGYVRVNRTQNPDLGLNVSRIFNTSTNLVNLSDYWNSYGGYYDPYYWGYGGYDYYYPPVYGYYQSTEAAFSVDLLDLKDASSAQTIKVIWNGLIRGEGIFNNSNVQSQAQALFDQSPYLKTNQ